jgi:uncharacterized protein (DUF1697 family)
VSQYVAFMRAINVAGHASVRMTDLRAVFTAAGCRNVTTFIQSGNVLFDSPGRGIPAILRMLRGRLRELLGDEPDVLLRSVKEIDALVASAPFRKHRAGAAVKLYVVFLSQAPQHKPRLPIAAPKEGLEIVGLAERDLFVVSRRRNNGLFGFPNAFVEKTLGVSATTRNWTTVTKIAALARTIEQDS